ncbi:MAG: hypothetical protein NTAFB09_06660 [Nitrosospira sp.]
MLAEMQVFALEKIQDGLSFPAGNIHVSGIYFEDARKRSWHFRRCCSVTRDIDDTGQAAGSPGTGFRKTGC